MKGVKRQRRTKGQWFFIVLLALAFAALLIANRGDIRDTFQLIDDLDLRIVLLLPLLQLLTYFFIANYYQSMLRAFKYKLGLSVLYPMVASLYFVEQVLPSGGASGVTYIAYAMRSVASVGMTSLVQFGRYAFNHLAYTLLLFIALLGLIFNGTDVQSNVVVIGTGLFVLMVAVAVGGLYVIRKPKNINRFIRAVSRFVNWLSRRFKRWRERPLINPDSLRKSLNDFHQGVKEAFTHKQNLIRPFVYMLLSALTQVSIVYLSVQLSVNAETGNGELVNPAIVLVSFTIANMVGVISFIPGDVGVHELTMIWALSAFGISEPVAISAILLYRVFNKLIMLAIGFFFYARFLKPAEKGEV